MRRTVAKPELGTKRLCPSCGTKYYDLDRNPILCPKCGTPFTIATSLRAKPAPAEEDDDLETEDETPPVDFVSLEEADAEAAGTDDAVVADDEEIPDIGDDLDDDTFLEEDEEDDDINGIDIDVAPDEEER
jgi:uncharacterized protein (TIGR02300 family)